MINKYELINYFNSHPEKGRYNKIDDTLTINKDKEDEFTIPMQEYVDEYRKISGESFECIYEDELDLLSVCLCTECKTMLFIKRDEYNYEPQLRCPVCTDYITKSTKYITIKQTEENRDFKFIYDTYIELSKESDKMYERMKRRNNKRDDQLLVKKINGIRNRYNIELLCYNINISRLRDLRLVISKYKMNKEKNITTYSYIKKIIIPLSFSAIKLISYNNKIKQE